MEVAILPANTVQEQELNVEEHPSVSTENRLREGRGTKPEKEGLIKWVKKPSSKENTNEPPPPKTKMENYSEFSWYLEESMTHYICS